MKMPCYSFKFASSAMSTNAYWAIVDQLNGFPETSYSAHDIENGEIYVGPLKDGDDISCKLSSLAFTFKRSTVDFHAKTIEMFGSFPHVSEFEHDEY